MWNEGEFWESHLRQGHWARHVDGRPPAPPRTRAPGSGPAGPSGLPSCPSHNQLCHRGRRTWREDEFWIWLKENKLLNPKWISYLNAEESGVQSPHPPSPARGPAPHRTPRTWPEHAGRGEGVWIHGNQKYTPNIFIEIFPRPPSPLEV